MRMIKIIGALVAGALMLASCAEPELEALCQERGETRPCTAKEKAMIDDMHFIIRTIHNYDLTDKSKTYWQSSGNSSQPKVIFYGEKHTEVLGQMLTLAALNAEARTGDVLLREGGDRNIPHQHRCGLDLIFQVFVQMQWEKLGRPYDPEESYKWRREQRFDLLLDATKSSYKLNGLSLANISCGYWDDQNAIEEIHKGSKSISRTLKPRNRAMTLAIKDGLDRYKRVIISTGWAHMPSMDMFWTQKLNPKVTNFPTTFEDYYQLVKLEKKKPEDVRSLRLDDDAGTTKVIYDFLKDQNIPYQERTHGKMIH